MKIEMDRDVLLVIEFMQTSIPAERLTAVAKSVAAISPLLWARHGHTEITPFLLASDQISHFCAPHKQEASI